MDVSRESRGIFYRIIPVLPYSLRFCQISLSFLSDPCPLQGSTSFCFEFRFRFVNKGNCSHFHSDHYGGMTASWSHGPIYCSSITANLVLQQIKVSPEYVIKLPMYQTVDVEGVDVTLIDANQYVPLPLLSPLLFPSMLSPFTPCGWSSLPNFWFGTSN